MAANLPITEADREAAADAYMCSRYNPEFNKAMLRTGNADEHPLIAAFARHRLTAIESAAKKLESLWTGTDDFRLAAAVKAIRALGKG